jgi:hypothetical protein
LIIWLFAEGFALSLLPCFLVPEQAAPKRPRLAPGSKEGEIFCIKRNKIKIIKRKRK